MKILQHSLLWLNRRKFKRRLKTSRDPEGMKMMKSRLQQPPKFRSKATLRKLRAKRKIML